MAAATATANKTVKKASPPKSSKASPSHPPYIQMITEALVALKERTGSSHHAIVKHIEQDQKIKDLPLNFKKILSVQLKKFVANGKLVMIKKSFKLPPKTTTTAAATHKPKAAENKAKKPATAAAAKPKAGKKVEKQSKSLKAIKSPMKKAPAVAKAKKLKSIKSPVKKVAAAAAAKVTTKKAAKK
ncbi:hypothetical protein KSS87_021330 [Heliosperma pusillum]|nr:hypothetical protein KSS87_021330 [Heliosperma pusillum]